MSVLTAKTIFASVLCLLHGFVAVAVAVAVRVAVAVGVGVGMGSRQRLISPASPPTQAVAGWGKATACKSKPVPG